MKPINNTNQISINLYQRDKILFLLKDVVTKYNLPCLKRKWEKIPLC